MDSVEVVVVDVELVVVVEVVGVVLVETLAETWWVASLLVILLVKISYEIPSSMGASAVFRWHLGCNQLVFCKKNPLSVLFINFHKYKSGTSPHASSLCRNTRQLFHCNQGCRVPNTGEEQVVILN